MKYLVNFKCPCNVVFNTGRVEEGDKGWSMYAFLQAQTLIWILMINDNPVMINQIQTLNDPSYFDENNYSYWIH